MKALTLSFHLNPLSALLRWNWRSWSKKQKYFSAKNATFEMRHLAANFIKPKWTQFSFWEILLFTTSKLLDQIKSYSWKTKFWISHACACVSIKKCRKDGITFDPVNQFWCGKKQNCSEWKSGSFRFNKVGRQMVHFKSCIFGLKNIFVLRSSSFNIWVAKLEGGSNES